MDWCRGGGQKEGFPGKKKCGGGFFCRVCVRERRKSFVHGVSNEGSPSWRRKKKSRMHNLKKKDENELRIKPSELPILKDKSSSISPLKARSRRREKRGKNLLF